MTLPANIRVNVGAPFPAIVKGSGVITIQKANGIWTVGFSFANLGVMPAGTDPTQAFLLVYNAINGVYQKVSISSVTSVNPPETVITNANSPYVPLSTDTFLMVDTTGGPVEIDLTAAAARNGVSLVIKDYKGNAANNNITIKPNGAETVDGFTNAAPLKINANYDGVNLRPRAGQYVITP